MARVMVPVSALKYDEKDAFPLDACEILDHAVGDQKVEETYTYTWRIGGPERGTDAFVEWRKSVCHRLRSEVKDKEAVERLIKKLDDGDWEVSFFVDTF